MRRGAISRKKYKHYIIEKKDGRLSISFLPSKYNPSIKNRFYLFLILLISMDIVTILIVSYLILEGHTLNQALNIIIIISSILIIISIILTYYTAWILLKRVDILITTNELLYTESLKSKIKRATYSWSNIKEFQLIKNRYDYTVVMVSYKNIKYKIANGMEKIEAQRLIFQLNSYRTHLIPPL